MQNFEHEWSLGSGDQPWKKRCGETTTNLLSEIINTVKVLHTTLV